MGGLYSLCESAGQRVMRPDALRPGKQAVMDGRYQQKPRLGKMFRLKRYSQEGKEKLNK